MGLDRFLKSKLGLGLRLVATVCLTLPLASRGHAENTTHTRKSTTTITTSETEGDELAPVKSDEIPERERTITAKFGAKGLSGTAGCKTEEASKAAIKDLKAECTAWIKEQKSELKNRHLTGSCEESCEDCGTSLRRCSMNGVVHYLLK